VTTTRFATRASILLLAGLGLLAVPAARSQDGPAQDVPAQDAPAPAPDAAVATEIRLLVRADDMGVAQAVNEGCIAACTAGIARSVEVIVPGAWFLDAVRLLKENPDIDVGVHLTLTSEWERVKWRPLTHAPSLVDADGYFRPMTSQRPDFPPGTGFLQANPDLGEVERELRAQIETARRHLGDRITHVSAHMMAATATPELKALTERLAAEYKLKSDADNPKYAGSFGTNTFTSDQREKALKGLIGKLKPGDWLLVEHPAFSTPETLGMGHKGYENVATDRSNVRRALTSRDVVALVKSRRIKLISYADVPDKPAADLK
jgi:predicted glycoside hydrolase/deacetylase ChbG (UPF0249 family)